MDFTDAEKDIMQLLYDAEQEAMQEMMKLPGWTYRDLPRMSEELMTEFKELIGEENLKWITFATYADGVSVAVRGQVMISPEGVERIRNYKKEG